MKMKAFFVTALIIAGIELLAIGAVPILANSDIPGEQGIHSDSITTGQN